MDFTNQEDEIVVFADMLGFAALTEENHLDVAGLVSGERILALDLEGILQRRKNPLNVAFSSFHFAVRSQIELASMSGSVTAITFSDSVFFATKDLEAALRFASELTFSLLSQGVPVRAGIASGSFAALRFRSDILKDGGDHATQFLGTAVVRACKAESCGVKGMRVLIHPSLEPLIQVAIQPDPSIPLDKRAPWLMTELSQVERANDSRVRYELNYWDLKPGSERAAWHKLQKMWASAPEFAKIHYSSTASAIDRMRVQKGEPPIDKLTRRTPPRNRR